MSDHKNNYLFRRFPFLKGYLPYVDLGLNPPSFYTLDDYPNASIVSTGHISPSYGGNKSYRLEFLLADAISKDKKHVITIGSTGSNHCVATAVFSQKLGLKCTTVLCNQPYNRHVKENMSRLKRFGAHIYSVDSLLSAAWTYYVLFRLKYPNAYFISTGGSNEIGTYGALNAAIGFLQEMRKLRYNPEIIFFPTASNGGVSALMVAMHLLGFSSQVQAIRLGSSHLGPFEENTDRTIRKSIKLICKNLNQLGIKIRSEEVRSPLLIHEYFGEAYAVPTAEGISALRYFEENTALELDLVYSSKVAAAFLDYAKTHVDKHIVFYHSYSNAK